MAARLQRDGHAAALRSDMVNTAIASGPLGCIAVTYIEWSSVGQFQTIVPWVRLCNRGDTEAAASAIEEGADSGFARPGGGRTSVSFAIDAASILLDRLPWSTARKIIDISANGTNNDGPPVLESRRRALEKGRVINVIAVTPQEPGITSDLPGYFKREVIGGPGSFVITPNAVTDYAYAIRKKLFIEVGDRADGEDLPGDTKLKSLVAETDGGPTTRSYGL
ncbi:DUF1194 domain-containing protein (plasmid) [Rhizobium sp. AB2/73]|uniref:DUF1194 domain-containing protein n=1 Tax=Rhizobium sp. AB2/73 TaxID=2795216 RepID=UPI000DDDB93C|nr:DUF1194 domain-containing protein [Rhizobium sp. AB2/73]UEQ84372.1 DUF1194 domain-containing protein [Rhizobium sp. AB2/73]